MRVVWSRWRAWEASAAFLGLDRMPEPAAGDAADAEVRRWMREAADGVGGARGERLRLAMRRSADLRALWYLRASFLQAIAAERGELQARREIAALDALFARAWPAAPVSRPGATR